MQEQYSDKEIWIITSEGRPQSPVTLYDFIRENETEEAGFKFEDHQLAEMRALEVGYQYIFNTVVGGLFKLTRVEPPLNNENRTLIWYDPKSSAEDGIPVAIIGDDPDPEKTAHFAYVPLNNPEAKKYLHLFSAVGEMLSALKLAGQVLDSMLNGQGLEANRMDEALSLLNYAIRKANGR